MKVKINVISSTLLTPVVLIGFAIILMLPYLPPHYGVNRDNGIFLYIGREITLGKIPYIDAWDHKGPLIFYINALGFFLGKRMGVWYFECLLLAVSTIVGYEIMKPFFKSAYVVWGTIAWFTIFFPFLYGGNTIEEFSIPLNFLSILFFLNYFRRERKIYPLLLGVMAGLNILLRPNNIGVQFIIGAIIVCTDLIKKNFIHAVIELGLIFLGVALILAPVFLYFYVEGALSEMIWATFIYNFRYATNGLFSKAATFQVFFLALGWPFWFALLGWLLVASDVLKRTSIIPPGLAAFLLMGFPLEIFLDTFSGRPYPHYMLMLVPYIALLNAYFFCKAVPFIRTGHNKIFKLSLVFVCLTLMSFSYWSYGILSGWPARVQSPGNWLNESSPVITYIKTYSSATDKVLAWGQAASLNVLSERSSPTRFDFQTSFVNPGFMNPEIENIFFTELESNRPRLVISYGELPLQAADLENFETRLQSVPPESRHVFRAFSDFVNTHYHQVALIDNYQIFILNQ